jgi:hypothetical protein
MATASQASAVLLHVLLAVLLLAGCSSPGPTGPPTDRPSRSASSTSSSPGTSGTPASGERVTVHDAATLQTALASARPGATISLADGTYLGDEVSSDEFRAGNPDEPGRFFTRRPGTATAPITLRGSRRAVLHGGGRDGGYGLHLDGASFWRLTGFTVTSASKGIVLDRSSSVSITDVRVTDVGAEGVHFRSHSSDNILSGSVIDHTGMSKPNFGEGVYIGSGKSNWGRFSAGGPDTSDRNQIVANRIFATRAENIDIKEGSSSGTVRGNTFDGSDIAGENSADSWIDVKGNDYTIDGNRGSRSLLDGFQVHVALDGWGRRNTFTRNVLDVQAPGVGIWLQNTAVDHGNVVGCDNVVTTAAAGDYATNHYDSLPCS